MKQIGNVELPQGVPRHSARRQRQQITLRVGMANMFALILVIATLVTAFYGAWINSFRT